MLRRGATIRHLVLLKDVLSAQAAGDVKLVPLDGSHGTPNLTFHCSVVSGAVYARGVPFLG